MCGRRWNPAGVDHARANECWLELGRAVWTCRAQPWAGDELAACLARAMEQVETTRRPRAVTYINEALNASVKGEWPTLEAARAAVAEVLRGLHYLMVVQVGFHRISERVGVRGGERWCNRYLVCFHAHGVVWGDRRSLDYRLDRLPSSLGAPGGLRHRLWRPQAGGSTPPRICASWKHAVRSGTSPASTVVSLPSRCGSTLGLRCTFAVCPARPVRCGMRWRSVLQRAVRMAEQRGHVPGC
jgi:hypothetical protein